MEVAFPNRGALGILGYGIEIVLAVLTTSPNKPKYQIKLQKSAYPNIYNVSIRCRGYASVELIKHHNIDCLKAKGCFVNTASVTINHYWTNVATIRHDDIEKLLAECIECNVHTEVVYERTNIFGNEVQESQKLYWHKHYHQHELK